MQERQKVLQDILNYISNSILKTNYGTIEIELNAGKDYIDIIKKERKRFLFKNNNVEQIKKDIEKEVRNDRQN